MPDEPHQALTMQLAQRALQRDRELGWELTANPARLRVQTIDALALWLAQQLPITTRFAGITQVTEQAEPLYSAAAHATLALIDSEEAQENGIALHVARLLTHLDNDWPRVHRLLSGMLARRDQWLRHVGHLDRARARSCRCRTRVAEQIAARMRSNRRRRCKCGGRRAGVDRAGALCGWQLAARTRGCRRARICTVFRKPAFERLDAWRALAALLLTNEGNWRTSFSKSRRLSSRSPPPRLSNSASVRCTDALRSNEALRQALHGLRDLPAPHFTAAQWSVLESIVGSVAARGRRTDAGVRRCGRERLRAADASSGRRARRR